MFTTDKTVQNFTQTNTFVVAELLTDKLSTRMVLLLYVLLEVNKIIRAQTVKHKNGHFIKLDWSIVCIIKQSLSSC